LYIAREYERVIDSRAIYKKKLIKIPAPEFIVLYNGEDECPDEQTLRLSDAYEEVADNTAGKNALELTVRVININEGRNPQYLKKSKYLNEYAIFIEKIRKNEREGMALEYAAKKAIIECVEQGILRDFLEQNGS
jgi:hypothetical protein